MAVNPEVRAEAKRRYLDGADPGDIAKELEINFYTLISWITRGSKNEAPWSEEKEVLEGKDVANAILDHNTEIAEIVSLGFRVIHRGMKYLCESCENVDLKDAERITKMIDTMHKWSEKDEITKSEPETSKFSQKMDEKSDKTTPIHPFLDNSNQKVD